jgi:hypothetical protein
VVYRTPAARPCTPGCLITGKPSGLRRGARVRPSAVSGGESFSASWPVNLPFDLWERALATLEGVYLGGVFVPVKDSRGELADLWGATMASLPRIAAWCWLI